MFTGGVVSYHTLLRIWDVYFLAGFDVFYFVALALLKTHQGKIIYLSTHRLSLFLLTELDCIY